MTPAAVDTEGGHKQEDVNPHEVVGVETVGQEDDQHEEDGHEEAEPGQEESPPPGPDPVTGETVDQGGDGGVEAKSPPGYNNHVPVRRRDVLGDGEDNHPDAGDQQAEVEKEEATEEGESPSENSRALANITEKVTLDKEFDQEEVSLPD